MKYATLLTISLLASVGFAAAAAVIPVANASFETTALADGTNNSDSSTVFGSGAADNAVGTNGVISGWTKSSAADHLGFVFNPTTGFTQATDGSNAAFVMNMSLTQNLSGFNITTGDTITVTFDAWNTNGGTTTLTVDFAGLGAQNVPPGMTGDGPAVGFSMDFIATSDITTADLTFRSTTGGHAYAIDNVAVSFVPEPSAAALLGLGGLALIVRRRRR